MGRGGYREGAGSKPYPPGLKKKPRITLRLYPEMWAWLEGKAQSGKTVNAVMEELIDAKRKEFENYGAE